jgi:SagB-type dehydrogenase family enzyme
VKTTLKRMTVLLALALAALPALAEEPVKTSEALPPIENLGQRLLGLSRAEVRAVNLAAVELGLDGEVVTALAAQPGSVLDSVCVRVGARSAQRLRELVAAAGKPAKDRAEAATLQVLDMTAPSRLAPYLGYVLYTDEEYEAAGKAFEYGFAAAPGKKEHYYQAACAWALAGDKDAAFRNLDRALAAGWYSAKDTREDKDLDGLHSDPRWEPLLAKMAAELARREAALPDSLVGLNVVRLPAPAKKGKVTVEDALWQRQSVRKYGPGPLTLAELGQLCFAAYGVNRPIPDAPPALGGGLKTAPSAGACYPLEVYVVAGNVTGLEPGVYSYRTATHELWLIERGDKRADLAAAALGQTYVRDAQVSLVWSAVFERNTKRYGDRGRERYVCMDVGHSGENVYLQAPALGLGTVAIGAFFDTDVKLAVGMTKPEEPLYIMPVGRLAKK